MQAILNVKLDEIDERFLNVVKELLARNIDIIIKKEIIELEEFDGNIPLDEVMREFAQFGYSENFLSDLKTGFETSEIYAEERNENKAFEG